MNHRNSMLVLTGVGMIIAAGIIPFGDTDGLWERQGVM